MELALLRFAGIYGLGTFAGGSGIGQEFAGLAAAALEGRPGTIGSGMPAAYEVVHVKDVAQGVALAASVAQLPHHVYNFGSGTLVTPADVLAALAHVVPGFSGSVAGGRPDPHPRRQPLDLSRSKAELGYVPRRDLQAGLRDLVEEMRAAS